MSSGPPKPTTVGAVRPAVEIIPKPTARSIILPSAVLKRSIRTGTIPSSASNSAGNQLYSLPVSTMMSWMAVRTSGRSTAATSIVVRKIPMSVMMRRCALRPRIIAPQVGAKWPPVQLFTRRGYARRECRVNQRVCFESGPLAPPPRTSSSALRRAASQSGGVWERTRELMMRSTARATQSLARASQSSAAADSVSPIPLQPSPPARVYVARVQSIGTRTSDYDFELADDRIAQRPLERRDASRLLIVDRSTGTLEHGVFSDLERLVAPGDVLVVNRSAVVRARLLGTRDSGAPAEVMLLRPLGPTTFEAMVSPGAKLRPGRRVTIGDDLSVDILETTGRGTRLVKLTTSMDVDAAIARYGHVPLPPYTDRADEPADADRDQTVFARDPGSVAAPTAGPHFTEALLDRMTRAGARPA